MMVLSRLLLISSLCAGSAAALVFVVEIRAGRYGGAAVMALAFLFNVLLAVFQYHFPALPLSRGGIVITRHIPSKPVQPRWLARAWARAWGYFWLPCPVCHEPFAGFEWGEFSLMTGPNAGTGVCAKPECQTVAKESTRAYWAKKSDDIADNKTHVLS